MIEKYIAKENPASIIFDPIPSYPGYWIFPIDNLGKNANKTNGVNAWEEFYKKTYVNPLKEILKSGIFLNFHIGMISMPNKDNVGRCLKYNKSQFYLSILSYLDQNIDRYGLNEEEIEKRKKEIVDFIFSNLDNNDVLNEKFSELFKERARRLKNLIDKVFSSEYYEASFEDYDIYKEEYYKYFGKEISFKDYVNGFYNESCNLQIGLLKLGDFFDRKIDFNELYKLFDPDKFFLLFAKIIYEYCLIVEKRENVLDYSYGFLYQYKNLLDEIVKDDRKYSPKITYDKIHKYSRWTFKDEFSELMERHPEAKPITLPALEDDNYEKYKDINLMAKITELYNEETKVNWEFLPAGESIKKGPSSSVSKNISLKIEKDEIINEVNLRIGILEKSGFIGTPVKGLNSFNGYYAFIYPNGKVILEKFWDNEENITPARNAATYVMTIDNFVEMSKLPRIVLVEYIRTLPEIGVKRIFHTSINNWQKNLYNEINGTYRYEDVIEFINELKTGETRHE